MTETPVLIVGGGPVGLTLALDLASRGQKCVLVEERTETTAHPKATLLGARSMEYYRRLGLDGPIYDAAMAEDKPYYIIFTTRLAGQEIDRFTSPSIRETRTRDPAAVARFKELAWSPYAKTQIGQQALEPVLVARALNEPNIDLRRGHRFEGFTQDETGVTGHIVDLETGQAQTVRAQYLAACDGGPGGIRRSLGIKRNGRGKMRSNISFYFKSTDFMAVHGRGLANLYFVFNPGSFGVFTAIDGGTLWNYQYYFADPTQAETEIDPQAVLFQAMGRPFEFELMGIMHWHHHQSVARTWRDGRVFLLGDSAHLFAPTGGVGMNTGIGDACDLSWKLDAVLRGWGGEGLLASYEMERKPIAVRNSIISATNSDKIDMVMDETPADIDQPGPEGDAQRALLKRKIRWLARQFNSAGTHLGYRYVDSPIVAGDGSQEPPDDPTQLVQSTWPGYRAPHAWMADGRSTLDLFGEGFTLLRFGDPAPGDGALMAAAHAAGVPFAETVIDDPNIARLYERRLVLVRPDGHVVWRGDIEPQDAGAVMQRVTGREAA
jgi:2-polyprenyl-6-methoxyphenol hydroxylase-like FAD-dependent oxidoreductase